MYDLLVLVLATLNTLLAFGGLSMMLWGQRFFREGLLVKTLKRGTVAAFFLLLHFLLDLIEGLGLFRVGVLQNLLELAFTLMLGYVTYGFIHDWKRLEDCV